jgi:hypothetical protein
LQLRPRTTPELIDAAAVLARATYGRLITIGALAFLPVVLVRVLGLRPVEDQVTSAGLVLIVYDLVWESLGWAAMLVVAKEQYLSGKADLVRAIGAVHADVWRITLLSVACGLLQLVGLALFIVPGIYFMMRFFAVPQTLLFERNSMLDALVRSLWLSRQDQWRLALAALFTTATSLLLWLGTAAVIRPYMPAEWLTSVVAGVPTLFIAPIFAAFWMLMYYDVRVRTEGFDLQQDLSSDVKD